MVDRIKTGSTLLDCALDGGIALGRFVTISGWQSTGKTGIAIEACTNFAKDYPDGTILYVDAESAFDVDYAERLGLPVDRVSFEEATTIEEFDSLVREFLANQGEEPGLIILDSLDALSTNKEKTTELKDLTGYGAEKAKLIGAFLKNVVSVLEQKNTCLLAIQQLRDNITGYGPKDIKSGGKSVGFYASQEIKLKKADVLDKTIDKVKKIYGVEMSFIVQKNKVGIPFREAKFPLLFGYGIDDVGSCITYLKESGRLGDLPKEFVANKDGKLLEKESAIIERIESTGNENDIKANRAVVANVTKQVWADIESKFAVNRMSKY